MNECVVAQFLLSHGVYTLRHLELVNENTDDGQDRCILITNDPCILPPYLQ